MKTITSFRRFISIASISIFLLISGMFFSSYIPLRKKLTTQDSLYTLKALLYFEKQDTNEYPFDLECFENNRFDIKDVLIDSWENTFYYESFDNGQNYLLFSKGKDGIPFTKDDVSIQ